MHMERPLKAEVDSSCKGSRQITVTLLQLVSPLYLSNNTRVTSMTNSFDPVRYFAYIRPRSESCMATQVHRRYHLVHNRSVWEGIGICDVVRVFVHLDTRK